MSDTVSRETRIDLVRGLSLLLIFAAHGHFVFSAAIQQSRGFADASELFVLMAGMSAALAYFSPDRTRPIPLRRIFARVRRIYAVHLVLVFALLAVVSLPSPLDPSRRLIENADVLAAWQFGDFGATPGHVLDALLLRIMPADLDILPLYVVIMGGLPLAILLRRHSAGLLLAVSAALWLASGALHLNLVNLAQDTGQWFFDPLSWQFVFVLGFLFGTRMKRGLDPFPFHEGLFRLSAAFALASIPANLVLQFTPLGKALTAEHHLFTAILVSKTFSGMLRFLDALAIVYILWNLAFVRRLSRAPWMDAIRSAGRHSLPVFSTGLVLSTAMQGLMASGLPVSPALQVALFALGCLVQLQIGEILERRRVAEIVPPVSAPLAS